MQKSQSRHSLQSMRWRATDTDSTLRTASIVIAGDTSPSEETIKACNGCDVLIHEARAEEMYARLPEERRAFGAKNQ